MYKAISLLAERYFEFNVYISTHSSKEQAEKIANSANNFSLVFHKGKPAIKLISQQKSLFRFDQEVIIREVREEKIRLMGRPLDIRDPIEGKIAIDALKNQDPAYTIQEEDMILSTRTLSHFLQYYGEGFPLESVAYSAEEITT